VKEIIAPEYEDEVQRPSVTLEDGRTFDADILIGADGPYSTVRAAIEEKPTVPTWTGLLAFSGVVPIENLMKDPLLRDPDISLGVPLFCGTYRGFMGASLFTFSLLFLLF
jgi:salicylate hydroxylase